MTPTSSRLRSPKAAFTIVELLVATAITLALGAMLVTMTTNVLEGWRRSSGRLTAQAQARIIFDQLEKDLAGLVYRPDGKCYLAATVLTTTDNTDAWVDPTDPQGQVASGLLPQKHLTLTQEIGTDAYSNGPQHRSLWLERRLDGATAKPLTIQEQRFGIAGTWLRFFSLTPDTKVDPPGSTQFRSPGMITAVSYQLVRRHVSDSDDSEQRWMLFRDTVRPYADRTPTTTRPGVMEAGLDLFPIAAENAADAALDSPYDIRSSAAPASNNGLADQDPIIVRKTHLNHVIGNNVVDFGVRFYRRQGSNLTLIFPAFASGINSGRIDMSPYQATGFDESPDDLTDRLDDPDDDLTFDLPGPDGELRAYNPSAGSDDIKRRLRFNGGVGTPNDGLTPTTTIGADISHFVSSRVVPSLSNPLAGSMPDEIEVMVRILTEEGARQIAALEQGRLGTVPPNTPNTNIGRSAWWWEIVEANSVVFTQRYEVKARPY